MKTQIFYGIFLLVILFGCKTKTEYNNSLMIDKLFVESHILLYDTLIKNDHNDLQSYSDIEYVDSSLLLQKIIIKNLNNNLWKAINTCTPKYSISDLSNNEEGFSLNTIYKRLRVDQTIKFDSAKISEGIIDFNIYKDFNSIRMFDYWLYDSAKFVFKKELHSFMPIIHGYRLNTKSKVNEPVYYTSFYIIPENKNYDINVLFAKVKFEFPFYLKMSKNEDLEKEELVVSFNSPYLNNYNKTILITSILNYGLDGKYPIYNFKTSEKLNSLIVKKELEQFTDIIEGTTFRWYNSLYSVIFIEDWYTNNTQTEIRKKVVGIAPVFYKKDDKTNTFERIVPFYIKFNEK